MFFLLVGFLLMFLMRWQLAWPGQPLPAWIGAALGATNAPGGIMLPEFYNQLVAMHGTVMVFLASCRSPRARFGNYLVPLQIGARTWRSRAQRASYWLYLAGGVVMLAELLRRGRRGQLGLDVVRRRSRSSRPPGQTCWLIGMFCLIASSLLGVDQLHRDDRPAAGAGHHAGCGCPSSCGRSW